MKVKLATRARKLKAEKERKGSWQNAFWVLLEMPLAQGSQARLQYTSKLQWSNILRKHPHLPQVHPHIIFQRTHREMSHVQPHWEHTAHRWSCSVHLPTHDGVSLPLQEQHPRRPSCSPRGPQFFSIARAVPAATGALTESLHWLGSRKKRNCSRRASCTSQLLDRLLL